MASWTIAFISVAVLVFQLLFTCASPVADELSLLQSRLDVQMPAHRAVDDAASGENEREGGRDLAFAHVPYNFGHTVESVAMFGSGVISTFKMNAYLMSLGGYAGVGRQASWVEVEVLKKQNGKVWGHVNPDLQVISDVTGCPMYYTPPKYWPQELAAKYFGNKTVFGILRDPYERLVAFFRGNLYGYGSGPETEKYKKSCDVNGGVKQRLKDYIAGNDPFKGGCTFLPQAEYFDGPYGITLPVNNREFPESMNTVFSKHGYDNMHIRTEDVMHVADCDHVWSGDFDEETRSLVRQVYKRDFALLCEHFGYCEVDENCCIYQVPLMCPARILKQGYHGQHDPSLDSVEHFATLDGAEGDVPRMLAPWQRAPNSERAVNNAPPQDHMAAVSKLMGQDVVKFVSNYPQAEGLLRAAAAIGADPVRLGSNHTLLDSFVQSLTMV